MLFRMWQSEPERTHVMLARLVLALLAGAEIAAAVLNPAELAGTYGYDTETHTVETADGYLLDVFRIRTPGSRPHLPVLLLPGLGCNAAMWVLLGPASAPAYLLADHGLDVWLGSYRGNMFARTHINYTDSNPSFWNFSFEDAGLYDIPSMVDRVLEVSGEPQLALIGHSMAAGMFLALASSEPHYVASKVSHAYLLAPAAFLSRTSSAALNSTVDVLLPLLRMGGLGPFGSGEINLRTWWAQIAVRNICVSLGAQCAFAGRIFVPNNNGVEKIKQETLSQWSDYLPDSIGVKNLEHFRQLTGLRRRLFQRYDYGSTENLNRYGKTDPPEYELSKVSVPVSIYYGLSDKIIHPDDALDLGDFLPTKVRSPFQVPNKDFNHGDFFLSTRAKKELYNVLLDDIDKDIQKKTSSVYDNNLLRN